MCPVCAGDASVVPVGATVVLRGTVLHACAAGGRTRSTPRWRRPARYTARLLTGTISYYLEANNYRTVAL